MTGQHSRHCSGRPDSQPVQHLERQVRRFPAPGGGGLPFVGRQRREPRIGPFDRHIDMGRPHAPAMGKQRLIDLRSTTNDWPIIKLQRHRHRCCRRRCQDNPFRYVKRPSSNDHQRASRQRPTDVGPRRRTDDHRMARGHPAEVRHVLGLAPRQPTRPADRPVSVHRHHRGKGSNGQQIERGQTRGNRIHSATRLILRPAPKSQGEGRNPPGSDGRW